MKTKEIKVFEVGGGATHQMWSDCKAYTVIAISKSGKQITMQKDIATLLNGPESGESDALKVYPGGFAAHVVGPQRYKYEHDSKGFIRTASLRKDGQWKISKGTELVSVGRYEHYDYNF